MTNWTNEVPVSPEGPAFVLLRTPANKPITAIVTSEDLIGCYTHFYKGRTIPCHGVTCPAHKANIPYRWHAYFAAYRAADGVHFIFETTAQAAVTFVEYRDVNKSLRGCSFIATRMNKRPNARVIIRTKPADLRGILLPTAPDVQKCMSIIWDIPTDPEKPDTVDPESTHLRMHPKPRTDDPA